MKEMDISVYMENKKNELDANIQSKQLGKSTSFIPLISINYSGKIKINVIEGKNLIIAD